MSLLKRIIERAGEEAWEDWIRRCLDLPLSAGQDTPAGPGSAGTGIAASATAVSDVADGSGSVIVMAGAPEGHCGALEEGEVWSAVAGLEVEIGLPAEELPGQRSSHQIISLPTRGPAKRRHNRRQSYSPSPPWTVSSRTCRGAPPGGRVARLEAGWGNPASRGRVQQGERCRNRKRRGRSVGQDQHIQFLG